MRRAADVMPGGNTRTTAHYPPFPLVVDRADGPFLWDADGNRLIDLLMNYTSLVHGHRYPPVVEAVTAALERGSAWPAASLEQVDLAGVLCGRLASVERVRFCNSGTEAGLLAVRIARRATGRRLLLKAAEGYHGSYDELDAGPETLQATYGDIESFLEQIDRAGDDLAAVVLEPVLASGGIITPAPGFLAGVAAAARACGALFVIDEVVTLRLGVGGAQEAAGVTPDLTMMGKLIGGGFPVGAVGGRAELMEQLDPRLPDPLQHSGTFNGNLITCAAGVAATTALTGVAIDRMAGQGRRLAAELEALAEQHAGSALDHLVRLAGGPARRPGSAGGGAPAGARPRALHCTAGHDGALDGDHDPLLDEVCERFAAVFTDAAGRG